MNSVSRCSLQRRESRRRRNASSYLLHLLFSAFTITLNHLGRTFHRSHSGSFIPLIVDQFLRGLCFHCYTHSRGEKLFQPTDRKAFLCGIAPKSFFWCALSVAPLSPPNPVSSRSIIISANHHTQHAPRPSPHHPSREEDVAVLLLCRLAASFRRVVLLPSPPPPRRDSARPDSSRWWWDRPPPYDDGIGITVRERSPRRPRPPPPPPRRLP